MYINEIVMSWPIFEPNVLKFDSETIFCLFKKYYPWHCDYMNCCPSAS